MLTRDFDFDLPAELIAQEPLDRGESRLMVLPAGAGAPRHRRISDLPDLLSPGDLLVVNDTRVLPARLFALRPDTGGRIELLLIEKITSLGEPGTFWTALAKPGKKARPGVRLELLDREDRPAGIFVEAVETVEQPELERGPETSDGRKLFRVSERLEPHLERLGHVPLPPYIKRPDRAADQRTYQTLFARQPGAIAAPTAGLHFSRDLLDTLKARGIHRAAVTLHVGIGTFKPVTAELAHEHVMDSERWEVPAATSEAIAQARAEGGKVVAVGTTVVRTLESAARGDGSIPPGSGRTELFIRPGYRFKAVDRLLTNFHLPRSTLLMLVSAFSGRERILAAYCEAIEERYRFFSYGDAMLVAPGRAT